MLLLLVLCPMNRWLHEFRLQCVAVRIRDLFHFPLVMAMPCCVMEAVQWGSDGNRNKTGLWIEMMQEMVLRDENCAGDGNWDRDGDCDGNSWRQFVYLPSHGARDNNGFGCLGIPELNFEVFKDIESGTGNID